MSTKYAQRRKARIVTAKKDIGGLYSNAEPCPYCDEFIEPTGASDWFTCPYCNKVFLVEDSDSDYVAWHGRTAEQAGAAPPPNPPLALKTKSYVQYKASDPNYNAKAGGVIAGNLGRATDGKFARAGGGGGAATAKPPDKKAQAKKDLADKQKTERDQQKADLAEQDKSQKRETRGQTSTDLLGDDAEAIEFAFDAVDQINPGDSIDDIHQEYKDNLEKRGLLKKEIDGSYSLTGPAKAYKAAAEKGDTAKAKEALRRGQLNAQRAKMVADRRALAASKKKPKAATKETSAAEVGTLKVFKDVNGAWRWILISSSSYQDKDKETIALKALIEDCKRADLDKNYGPLLWWHMPKVVLGYCDFNAVSGRLLVESGTFKSEKIARAVSIAAPDLGASLGFLHPLIYPDQNKVYWKIKRFERSLLPAPVASNWFTKLFVRRQYTNMDADKIAALKEKFKSVEGQSALDELLAALPEINAQAEKSGLAYKAAGDNPDPNADPSEPPETQAELDSPVGDMEQEDFVDLLKTALQPLVDAVSSLVSAMGGQASEQAATKQSQEAALNQANAALTSMAATVKNLTGQVEALKGDLPRGVARGYSASSDPATITKKAANEPTPDPLDTFVGNLFGIKS